MFSKLPSMMRTALLVPVIATLSPIAAAQDTAQDDAPIPVLKFGYYGDVTYGNPDGVDVIEYMSLTCGHCGHFQAMIMPGIMTGLIEPGHVSFTVKNLIRDGLDMAMVVTARCRDEDFAKKAFRKLLLEQQRWLSGPQNGAERQAAVNEIFAELGMAEAEMQTCLTNQDLAKHIYEDVSADTEAYDIKGTPTVLVEKVKVPVRSADDLIAYVETNYSEQMANN